MTSSHAHVSTFTEDDDGWVVVSCTCGFEFRPLPDMETAADVWGDHRSDTAADPAATGDQPSPWTPEREAAGAALDYAEGRISYDAFEKAVARYSNSLDAADPAPTGDTP